MIKLPEQYEIKMRELLAGEWDAYRESFQDKRQYGLRANLLKITAERLKEKLPFLTEAVRWCPEGFTFDGEVRPAKSPYYHAGLFYLQEPSAMSPVAVAEVRPGMRVLDICAAPGGKATQAAAAMRGRGLLVANDISATRCKALVKNIEISGVTNAVVLNEPPEKLSERFAECFDRVFIDAPCSGEGMFRKDPEAVKSWEAHKPEACMALQRGILSRAAKMTKPGGRIVYSTCTFEPGENEGMIDEFLTEHPEFSIVPLEHGRLGLAKARPEWGGGRSALEGCARLWPHLLKGEGHFLCVMERQGEPDSASTGMEKPRRKAPEGLETFQTFCETVMTKKFTGVFERHGPALFLVPEGLPDLSGIRIARNGWYLGDVKANRFEPSQAFAMGLTKEDVKNRVSFAADSREVLRYLKGESFEVDAAPGWVLVCVEEYPLGWGKVVDGRMKNKYLKGWFYE